jgi:hypothetical protein
MWTEPSSRPLTRHARPPRGAIRSLKEELGVRPVMLPGDSRTTAQRIAAEVGTDEVFGSTRPPVRGLVPAARRARRAVLRVQPRAATVDRGEPRRSGSCATRHYRPLPCREQRGLLGRGLARVRGAAILLGLSLIFSHRFPRARSQRGVLLGAAAGLGFGVSDVAIKAVSGDVAGGLHWIVLAVCAGIAAFFASARSLQVGEGSR